MGGIGLTACSTSDGLDIDLEVLDLEVLDLEVPDDSVLGELDFFEWET